MSTKEYEIREEDDFSNITVEDLDFSTDYTYADYLKWTFEDRLELIKGKLFKMSAPATNHQILCGRIFSELYNYLKGKPCMAFIAPYDVRLPRKSKADKDIITVVQPDAGIICDPSKIDKKGCIGAPDIVVEILSPGNTKKELRNKYEVYEESGVKEYWIIYPEEQTFLKYVLDEKGKFQPSHLMTAGDQITTPILPGFELDLEEFFKGLYYDC
jgi:Uma2 family endonuclease